MWTDRKRSTIDEEVQDATELSKYQACRPKEESSEGAPSTDVGEAELRPGPL